METIAAQTVRQRAAHTAVDGQTRVNHQLSRETIALYRLMVWFSNKMFRKKCP